MEMERGRGGMRVVWSAFPFAVMLALSSLVGPGQAAPDYSEALRLSLYFFEAQRSGYLPADQRVTWRSNSGLNDGKDQNVDLVGGYYDAGDNVKFQLPMAFTVTTLSWSVIEYRSQLQKQGQLDHALSAIKWGTDYFIKAHPEPNVLWAEVGDGASDHECWMRPEDMTTSRQSYKVDVNNPGSEVAAETAAAMAAASVVFKYTDPAYSQTLLTHAKQLFTFADTHRSRYDHSISIAKAYYPSVSGYGDELLWAAFWLFEASGDENYLEYTSVKAIELGGTGWAMTQFGWDVKYSGLQVLAAKILLEGKGGAHTATLQSYQKQASYFLCSALGKNNGKNIHRSPGGLFWIQPWNNMQFVTSAAFLLTVYADYLTAANQELTCEGSTVPTSELRSTAQKQIDYLLGNNPRGMSYMVGYSNNYPKEVHHRGSSIVSIKVDPAPVQCKEGYASWYKKPQPNPNVLLGAVVGGPDANDYFIDDRDNYQQTEACLYNNGPLVGVLARLSVGPMYRGESDRPKDWESDVPNAPEPPQGPPPPQNSPYEPFHLTQWVSHSWKANGLTYYKYEGAFTNTNWKDLKDIVLNFSNLDGPVYGLNPVSGSNTRFTFPAWMDVLKPGQKLTFVYIHPRSMASISVKQTTYSHILFRGRKGIVLNEYDLSLDDIWIFHLMASVAINYWKITELVQEWQNRSSALVELRLLDLKWEGFWIQGIGCAWLLLYRCIYRLVMVWFMYGRLGVGALLVFAKSLARKLSGLPVS